MCCINFVALGLLFTFRSGALHARAVLKCSVNYAVQIHRLGANSAAQSAGGRGAQTSVSSRRSG